jgi:hypothetical protein
VFATLLRFDCGTSEDAIDLIHQKPRPPVRHVGRIYIERVINEPFVAAGGSADQFRAGIERALRSAGYGCTRATPT